MSDALTNSSEIQKAFVEYDRQVILNNVIIGCLIGIVLMPVGTLLDYKVYKDQWVFFFKLRLLCSLLIGAFWLVVITPFGRKHPRKLGVLLAIFPAFFISWMIYAATGNLAGANSPYYAGLNLVLLVVGFVLHWTFVESLTVVSITTIMYIIACVLHGNISGVNLLNNLYFLILTGVIIVTGSYFHNKTRFREFAFRYELDKSKQELESSNTKLSDQNMALNKANREIKETEMQLVQSEKMSSLGRFSAGLMHDILNPLNYSRTGLFVLRKKTRKLPPELLADTDAVLNDIEDGLKRVEDIVSDLRTFTHPGVQASEAVDLADIFNLSLRFISSELKDKNIALNLQLEPGQTVWASRNHFILVLVNLLENAIDAMGGKPFANGVRPAIDISSHTEGERTLLRIRDNGVGIAPQNLPKIFDPFFTTKEVGKGTGLGLSICFGIVRGYGGTIAATSELGQFSEFTLDLPATAEAAALTQPENAEPLRL